MIQKGGQCSLTQFTAWTQENDISTRHHLRASSVPVPSGRPVGQSGKTDLAHLHPLEVMLYWGIWCRSHTGSIWCETDPALGTLSEDRAGECFILALPLGDDPGTGILHSLLEGTKIQLLWIEVVWLVDFQTLPYALETLKIEQSPLFHILYLRKSNSGCMSYFYGS